MKYSCHGVAIVMIIINVTKLFLILCFIVQFIEALWVVTLVYENFITVKYLAECTKQNL
jgi:hypothetical protein